MPANAGVKHHGAKMTTAKVKQARKSYEVRDKNGNRKYTLSTLAEKYDVTHGTMWSIINRRTWKHVKP